MIEPHHLIATYGYWAVMLLVGVEGIGLPVPGETALVSASLFAGSGHGLNIVGVILAALGGAVTGDNLGFWLGRGLGTRLLLRYGRHVGLDDGKLKVGQYLFRHYGGWVVAFGRFVAILRTLAPFLAGANRMPWPRFFLFNLGGSLLWASATGTTAYLFGHAVHRLVWPVGLALALATGLAIALGIVWLRRHYRRIQAAAEREFPGPLA